MLMTIQFMDLVPQVLELIQYKLQSQVFRLR